MSNNNCVTVLGGGAWGTAVATLLANNGKQVKIWCFEESVVDDINKNLTNNKFLHNIKLPANIKATNNLQEALADSEFVFEAIPMKFLRNVLTQAKNFVKPEQNWVILSKGIEQHTFLLPSQIIDEIFGASTKKVVLGGPNFAHDLAEKAFTGSVLASTDRALVEKLNELLVSDYFKTFYSEDIVGVEVGGAIKNLIAVTVAIAEGAGFKDNTAAFLFTRGLQEMVQIALYFGGHKETLYGLAGIGDMMLTCSARGQSRNLKVGRLLGQGLQLNEIAEKFTTFPEGINTVQAVYQLMQAKNLNLPICKGTYEFIFQGKSFKCLMYKIVDNKLEKEFLP